MPRLGFLLKTAAGNPAVMQSADNFLRHYPDTIDPPSAGDLEPFINCAKDPRICRTRPQQTAIFQLSRLGLIHIQSCFPHLNHRLTTYQLIRRIIKPSLFDQGSFGLCGPAAFVITECAQDPVAFASFAVQLFETGSGTLKGREIAPAPQIRNFNPANHGMGQADFLILASVRDSQAALNDQTNFAAYDGTGLGWMFEWFVQAGYPRVLMIMGPPPSGSGFILKSAYGLTKAFSRDSQIVRCHPNQDTFGVRGLNPEDKLRVLQTANFFLKQGYKVMMGGLIGIARAAQEYEHAAAVRADNAPAALVEGLENFARNRIIDTQEQHWVIVEDLEIRGGQVEIRLISWAKTIHALNMPLEQFLDAFVGFVAASPVPQHVPLSMAKPF